MLAELAASGELYAIRSKTSAFGDAIEAYRALETGHPRGKIVVHVSD